MIDRFSDNYMIMFMFMIHPVWARLKLALTLAILCDISSAILNDVNSGISNYIEAKILKNININRQDSA